MAKDDDKDKDLAMALLGGLLFIGGSCLAVLFVSFTVWLIRNMFW